MRYIHVQWLHENPDDPIELYSELDDGDWEVRKVEVYRGGRFGYAGASESSESTSLGLEPVPDLHEIALDPHFRAREITLAEFEPSWDLARTSSGPLRGRMDSRSIASEG